MIKIEKVSIHGLEETIRGMRNPMNSWDKSDSGICKVEAGIIKSKKEKDDVKETIS